MKMKRFLTLFIFAAALLTSNGCALFLLGAGVGAGAATVAYVKGELSSTEEVPLDRAWPATLAALRDLGYEAADRTVDEQRGSLIARRPGDEAVTEDVTVKLERKTLRVTELKIRVGVFGDEEKSRRILERIRMNY